jgi:hypothetical protein
VTGETITVSFEIPELDDPGLHALAIMTKAWGIASRDLNAGDKDRTITYMVSLLNSQKSSHPIEHFMVAPGARSARAR